MKHTFTDPDGTVKTKRLWGIRFYPARRAPKRKFFNADGSFKEKEFEQASLESANLMLENLPSIAEDIADSYFVVYLTIQGKQRYVGMAHDVEKAQQLYDSALFHLWGYLKNPKPRFNLLKFSDLPKNPPAEFLEISALREKLDWELRGNRIDPTIFHFNYIQKNVL